MYSVLVGKERYVVYKMYDIDGDETDDPFMAIHVTSQKGDTWLTIPVNEGDIKRE